MAFLNQGNGTVNKAEVLTIFANAGIFLKPDRVLAKLGSDLDRRSFYSYLARLRQQGLLDRVSHSIRGELAYRISERGKKRLAYLREHPPQRGPKNR